MAVFKCKNFGSCGRADRGEELALAVGADDKCPECGFSLVGNDDQADSASGSASAGKRRSLLIGVSAIVAMAVLGFGYSAWQGSRVAVLKPDRSTAPPLGTGQASAPSPAASPVVVAAPAASAPEPTLGNEVAARRTCDEATKAGLPNADKICRRAAAITLMNSGVQAAVKGSLDQAEKDYLAARDKDADLPELYFNFAVLKARQNKGSEAVDNLVLADTKGFTQFSAIKSEPALQKLKSNPELKAKIEAFEAK